jgi:pre-mRNA-splicing factor ATP-dependent RNA helicase DHX15/PRP43
MSEIQTAIRDHPVVVLCSQTGSGKTTQLAKEMVDTDEHIRVVLTQNRRLAVTSVGSRIASELDVAPGFLVGLRFRGESSASSQTRLDVVTDGTLLAMAKGDPRFTRYDVVIVDEAHAHTVATDMVMGLLKIALENGRSGLKVVIMSATINQALFSEFLPQAFIKEIPGRAHAVRIRYLEKEPSDYDFALVNTIIQVHLTGRAGNILVFVSGQSEIVDIIDKVKRILNEKLEYESVEDSDGEATPGTLVCYKLFGALSAAQQDHTVNSVAPINVPDGSFGRKLIVATNIAETSITLTGVTHVIDSCRAKSKLWNVERECWALKEHWISKAQVAQRSGRAGRTSDGESYIMMTEAAYLRLSDHPMPDMRKGDMVRESLQLLQMGHDPIKFPYINSPAPETINKALGMLVRLGLINSKGEISDRGTKVESFGVDAQLGVALIESVSYGCSDEIISIIAMVEATESSGVFLPPRTGADFEADMQKISDARKTFKYRGSDHLTYLNMYMAWRQACVSHREEAFIFNYHFRVAVFRTADATRKRLLKVLYEAEIETSQVSKHEIASMHGRGCKDYHLILIRCLAAGNYLRVAKRNPATGIYETVPLSIPVGIQSSFKPTAPKSPSNEWVIYGSFDHDPKTGNDTISAVTAISPEYLFNAAPNYWADSEFMPAGHIQDGIAAVVARMTNRDPSDLIGGMPPPALSALANLTTSEG